MASSDTQLFLNPVVFFPEVFNELSRGEPASICEADQSPKTSRLAGHDGPDRGGVRRDRFDRCDLHRNCTDSDDG
jgi:hypothetical protein